MSEFTWIPFYKELADKLLKYRDRQGELITILKKLKDQGLPVIRLIDEDKKGKEVPLKEIDPFTFFSSFNRGSTDQNRRAILTSIKQSLQLRAAVPSGFEGIPVMDPRNSWFFAWEPHRKADDIPALWAFAEAMVTRTPEDIDPALFDRCLEVSSAGVTNLTMGMYWMRPDTYLALDSRNRKLLDARGITHPVRDWASYVHFLKEARSAIPEKPYEFSYAAYKGPHPDIHYWKVSHGEKDFTNEQRRSYIEQHTIHVHEDTLKGQGDHFATVMKEGDFFYLCHGNDDGIRIFGRVAGPAVPSLHGKGWLQRKYDVIFMGIRPSDKYNGIQKGWAPNYNSTCKIIPDEELSLFESEILMPFFGKRLSEIPAFGATIRPDPLLWRNIILYGPPGTGKTYTLRNYYMKRFTESAAITSKEDFAADLVADLAWWQVITMVMLDLKTSNVSGILAHPLMQARIRRANNQTPRAAVWAHLQIHTKTDCAEVKYSKRYEPLLFSKDANSVWSIDVKLATEEAADLVEALERYRGYASGKGGVIKRYEFTTFHQSYSYEDFVEGIKPVMSEEVAETLAYEVKAGIFKTMVKRALADPSHDYALLIDEINRGNVASIFGELITLIEEDKRLGAPNELRARLPYSREEFVVPKNLSIIGAMNTADRSVEALDTALRRRFTFVAIPPQPERIQQPENLDVDLRKLLGVINARIEKLLDKDHCIGHSYFMDIAKSNDPLAELQNVFSTKILPLMEEYFYGDPAKIGMVLGERFVTRKDDAVEWAKGDWGMDEFEERQVYALRDPMTLKDEDFRAVYE